MLYKEKSSVSTSSLKICVGQSIRRSQPNTNAFVSRYIKYTPKHIIEKILEFQIIFIMKKL